MEENRTNMKVKIELNNDVSIENIKDNDNEVKLNISIVGKSCAYAIINIYDLKLAIRKLTEK